ncbi:MAG: heme exporter protein CcmB [Chlorobi bacterium]|nr:heme exporter protein CcmB [Chlorobiota bacterium]
MWRAFFAIVRKEFLAAFRSRHNIAAELYFVVGSVLILVLGFPQVRLDAGQQSGVVWVVVYFVAMMTVARSYVIEQERSTLLYVMHVAPADAVYWGKLVASVLWLIVVGGIQMLLMGAFSLVPVRFESAAVVMIGCAAIGAATSLLAAIVAAARLRNWVFAAIAFPIVMPIFFLGVDSLATVLAGGEIVSAVTELTVMLLYVIVVAIVAWWLFPFIWSEA